jgi:hypothetical protein
MVVLFERDEHVCLWLASKPGRTPLTWSEGPFTWATSPTSEHIADTDIRAPPPQAAKVAESSARDKATRSADWPPYILLGPTLHSAASHSMPIPAEEPDSVGFLSLPPELRNRIYDLVLGEFDIELVLSKSQPRPPLLRTCRQIRAEASMLYYARTFLVTSAETNCVPWLRSIPAAMRKHMKPVRLLNGKKWFGSYDVLICRLLHELGRDGDDVVLQMH